MAVPLPKEPSMRPYPVLAPFNRVGPCKFALLEFTVTGRSLEAVAFISQFGAVEDIAVVIAIGVVATEDISIRTADAEVPRFAAKIIVDFSDIGQDIVFIFSGAIIREGVVIAADTVSNLRAVVNLCVSAEANTIIPRFIIFFVVFLIPITKTGVTGQFHVTDAVFESTDANAEVIEFIGEFIGQFVDEARCSTEALSM